VGVQDKKVTLDTKRAKIGIQGGAERGHPCGWGANKVSKRASHCHFILTANAFRRTLIFLVCAVFVFTGKNLLGKKLRMTSFLIELAFVER